jgi:hypothetical protein
VTVNASVWAVSALVLASCLACAHEAPKRDEPSEPRLVEGWPSEGYASRSTSGNDTLVEPISIPCLPNQRYLVVVRLTLEEGAVDVTVGRSSEGRVTRSITRLGPYLALLPVVAQGDSLSVSLLQKARSGPVRVELGSLRIQAVEPDTIESAAAALVSQFEGETGRIADPISDNLVPNANFAEDDEVRGLPAHWSAYADVTVDDETHVVSVTGAPYEGRPFLASGPVALIPGRRYRAECRLRNTGGALEFRAVDYDERDVLAATEVEPSGPEFGAHTLELVAPPDAKAVRLWLAPRTIGGGGSFELRTMQLELLPMDVR